MVDSALALNPVEPMYLLYSAQLLLDRGLTAQAVPRLEHLARTHPGVLKHWQLLHRYATAVGDTALAREAAERQAALNGAPR